jgi:hypothetical protein
LKIYFDDIMNGSMKIKKQAIVATNVLKKLDEFKIALTLKNLKTFKKN